MNRHNEWCEEHGEFSSHHTIPPTGCKTDVERAPKGQGQPLSEFKQHLRDIRKEIWNED